MRLEGALLAAPFAVVGYGGFIERLDFRVREVEIPVPGLPADLDGLRLLHLSDIHLSAFLSERDLARVIDSSNELHPHLALVTGDLITTAGDPLDACLRQIARLRTDAGILGCMGNHEFYAQVEAETEHKAGRLGIPFLRGQAKRLQFGSAQLNVAGVDYQRSGRHYLRGAESMVLPGAYNILLSHNPDVFPAVNLPLSSGRQAIAFIGRQRDISIGISSDGLVMIHVFRDRYSCRTNFTAAATIKASEIPIRSLHLL